MKTLGLLAAFFHLFLFAYIYLTSTSYLSTKDFTLSSAFQYSEKLGSVALVVITCVFLLLFLKNEGYLQNNYIKYLFTIIFFIWLLFFTEHDNHSFFAFIGLVIIVLIPYIICNSNKNNYLFKIALLCSFFVALACLFFACDNIFENDGYFRFLFSCVEIIIVFSYFLFLLVMSFTN